jgi:predicted dehydrogenase
LRDQKTSGTKPLCETVIFMGFVNPSIPSVKAVRSTKTQQSTYDLPCSMHLKSRELPSKAAVPLPHGVLIIILYSRAPEVGAGEPNRGAGMNGMDDLLMDREPIGMAFIGCGYVADAYRQGLPWHADRLRLVGVYDHDPGRAAAFHRTWGGSIFDSLAAALNDTNVAVVVNLTSPESHAAVTAAAIAAGRHVYSEKPLAMTAAEAGALRDAAKRKGVSLAAAPGNLLGETAQTLWKALRERRIGTVRLVYAELDDGMIHKAGYQDWTSASGHPWPAESEFATGCTYEHAGYILTLLAAMFGPARRVTAFSSRLIPGKLGAGRPVDHAPDFSVGLIEFDDGVVARLTNSIVAPYDHRLRIIGEDGMLLIAEPWDYAAPLRIRKTSTNRFARILERRLGGLTWHRLAPVRRTPHIGRWNKVKMDYLRGVRDLAEAVAEGRSCRLNADLGVHITEITEILQHPERFPRPAPVIAAFDPIAPMPWAM